MSVPPVHHTPVGPGLASRSLLLSRVRRLSFAIDWRPAQRLLLYLKSAALVCHLEVEEGYPSAGRARLVSVQRDGRAVDTSGLQVPEHSPRCAHQGHVTPITG